MSLLAFFLLENKASAVLSLKIYTFAKDKEKKNVQYVHAN